MKRTAAVVLLTGCMALSVPFMTSSQPVQNVLAAETEQQGSMGTFETLYNKVSFPENPSTGYTWKAEIEKEGIINIKESFQSDPAEEGATGVGGTKTFELEGLKEGSTNISFRLQGPSGDTMRIEQYWVYASNKEDNSGMEVTLEHRVSYEADGKFVFDTFDDHDGISSYRIEDESIIKMEKEEYPEGDKASVEFVITPLKKGTTKVTFYYAYGKRNVEKRTYKVTVADDKQMDIEASITDSLEAGTTWELNKTTGYDMRCEVGNQKYAKITDEAYILDTAQQDLVGVGGVYYVGLRGVKQGSTTLTAHTYKAAQDGQETVEIGDIKVGKNLEITFGKPKTYKVGHIAKFTTKRKNDTTASVTVPKLKNVTGYKITYATDKNLTKGKKTVKTAINTNAKTKKQTVALKSLKKGKSYYVQVQAYRKLANGKVIYSTPDGVEAISK